MQDYLPDKIEPKWQKYWEEHQTFRGDSSKPKYYVLDMSCPFDSDLQDEHPRGHTAADIVSRMKRMQGYHVLHPMGHPLQFKIWGYDDAPEKQSGDHDSYEQELDPVEEPFKKIVCQGKMLGESKMKIIRRYPDLNDLVRDYGADTIRLHEMFMGPLEYSCPWSDSGIAGARKFLDRVWNFFANEDNLTDENDGTLTKIYHQTVKKVTDDFEQLQMNTAISQMMIFLNAMRKKGSCPKEYAESFIKMLSCICPHIGEELWQILGHDTTIAFESWPAYSEEELLEKHAEIAIQVNGKIRGTLEIELDEEEESVKARVWNNDDVRRLTDGKRIVMEKYVKERIYIIVAE